jgi:glycosyltransferase involved in cell wall biosynthesis
MNQKPLVSIITPTLNYGHFLEKTIQSIISQDYINIEHIIIDGLSTDNTFKILKKYEKKYNLRWVSEKDRSPAHAYDKGLKMAKGEIIGWCNADDYYVKGTINKIVEVFINNPEVDLIFGACQEFDYRTNTFSKIYRQNPIMVSKITSNDILSGEMSLHQPSLFYRKSIIQKVGPLNPDLEAVEDVEMIEIKQGPYFKEKDKIKFKGVEN